MKDQKKLLVFFALLLSACGGNGVSSSASSSTSSSSTSSASSSSTIEDSSSVSSSSSVVSSSSSFVVEDLVPDGFIDNLNGTYYGEEGTLIVTDETVMLNDLVLSPTKFVVEQFKEKDGVETKDIDHAVTYLRNGADEYRIYLSGNGRYLLNFDKKEGSSFKTITTFMPSIEEFTGSYSAYGDGDEYNIIFNFGNNYNKYNNGFDILTYGLFAGYSYETYYAKSYMVYLNDELTTAVSMLDFDDYEYYAFTTAEIDGSCGLIEYEFYEEGYLSYYYDPLFLSLPYFASADDVLIGTNLDVIDNKVTINDVTYSYSMYMDETLGHVTILTSDDNEVKVYPNQYGINWEENGNVKTYVFDNLGITMDTQFTYEDMSFVFTYDDNFDYEVRINDVATDFTYDVYNNRKAIKVTVDNNEYYFSQFKGDIVLLVGTQDNDLFYINKERFSSLYGKTFINKVDDSYKEIEITSDFTVNYDGTSVDANLYFDPAITYPYLEFSVNDVEYKFSLLQENIGAATLVHDDVTENFFDQEIISQYYGEYTSHHEVDLNLAKTSLNYFGTDVDYTIEPYYYDYLFTYIISITFNVDNKEVTAFIGSEMIAMDIVDDDDNVETQTFIKFDQFQKLIGEYSLYGTFGQEQFKLTEDGHFYADTLNGAGTALEYAVEYDYSLQMVIDTTTLEYYPSIIFYANTNVGVQLVKIGHTLVLGGSVYTANYLYNYHGVYVSSDNTKLIELREDSLYVNGDEAIINSISYDENSTIITATVNFVQVTYTFTENDGNVTVSSNENGTTEYTKSTFDLSTLVGPYEYNGTTYTVSRTKIPLTSIDYGYSISDGFLTSSDYSVVLRNGNVALEFTLGLNTIYVYCQDGVNVIEVVEPSLPPLPPAPPAPPIL